MPISRPLLIVLAVAVLALAGFYATQGSRDASSGGDDAAEVAPPAPSSDSVRADAADASKPETAKPKPRDAEAKAQQARAQARREAEEQRGMPLAVARALNSPKLVVLLLRGTDSVDDRAAARAVAGLRGQRGLAVFSDRIGRLGRYRAVVGDLGISQAPAVVIVDRGRTARVVQGYIDPATLAQDVADAR